VSRGTVVATGRQRRRPAVRGRDLRDDAQSETGIVPARR